MRQPGLSLTARHQPVDHIKAEPSIGEPTWFIPKSDPSTWESVVIYLDHAVVDLTDDVKGMYFIG
jgi:hypothetical protein